jgi:hypothetical protein
MDCLLEEIKTLKKFKREHPKEHQYDDSPSHKKRVKANNKESIKEKMARLRAMRGKK